jgi:transposase
MSKTTSKLSPELRERAVRLVFDNERQHGFLWQAILSIAAKIGCSAHTLSEWVKKVEVDRGQPAGAFRPI